jgi:voltage-gated potassium channel
MITKKAKERKLYILWHTCLLMSIFYTFVNSTLSHVFGISPSVWAGVIDIFITVIFAIDVYFKVKSIEENSFYALFRNNFQQQQKTTYAPFHIIVDGLSLVPWQLISLFLPQAYWGLRAFDAIKVLKIPYFIKNNNGNPLAPASVKSVITIFTIFTCIHGIAYGWMLIGGVEVKDWITSYNKSIYWAITTLTTIGYGDITPTTNIGRVYTMVIMIIGVGTYGFIIGNVSRFILNADKNKEAKREKLNDISLFMTHYGIPQTLQRQVFLYYNNLFEKRLSDKDAQLISELPQALQNDINLYMKIKLIRNLHVFSDSSIACLKLISRALELKSYSPGEYIIHKGDEGHEMFIINHGEVEVIVDDNTVATFTDGQFFGEIALLQNVTRTADVKSKTYTELYTLNKEDFVEVTEKFPKLKKKFESQYLKRESDQKKASNKNSQKKAS